ncbi:unnamed protein product [Closterium sp. Naga37s-1]|nr:unnamed protein product [Closterium sp. Naga37s-1]
MSLRLVRPHLAASLLAAGAGSAAGGAGSGPRPVGFGGYVGSARVQTAAAGAAGGGRESAEGGADGGREGQRGAVEASAGSGPKELVIGADVGGEAAAHLRRLAKKDATTKVSGSSMGSGRNNGSSRSKASVADRQQALGVEAGGWAVILKAVEALQGVLGGSTAAQMQAMLPAWAFEYRRLVVDSSRAVRLATHATMTVLVQGINFQSLKRHPCLFLSRSHGSKGLAPHLKQLMGPWWVAQFDSSRDVAAAATVSFQVRHMAFQLLSPPASHPSAHPASHPAAHPASHPSAHPASHPSAHPASHPAAHPASQPSAHPASHPSAHPASHPAAHPASHPSAHPASHPAAHPASHPSAHPASQPSAHPASHPSAHPASHPSAHPASHPSAHPASHPFAHPAAHSATIPAAFPTPTRRVEALAFTWEAVVGTLAELLAATPQSLAAADRSLSVEEAKHRLDEVRPSAGAEGFPADPSLLSSLRALSFLRALAKHPSPRVHSAAFHALPAVLLSLGPLAAEARGQEQEGEGAGSQGGENQVGGGAGGGVGGEMAKRGEMEVMGEAEVIEKVGPVVAAAMGEKVSACHGAMWELVLVASCTCPSLWANPSFLKSALPKLWGFLRAGCLGSAEQSYPCLLPLLSVFFRARLHQSQGVLVPFFSNLWQGRLVHMARPDWLALLTCVRECLVLSVVQLRRDEEKAEGKEQEDRGVA